MGGGGTAKGHEETRDGGGNVLCLSPGDGFKGLYIILSKFIKLYTSSGCNLFYMNYTSIKLIFEVNNQKVKGFFKSKRHWKRCRADQDIVYFH